MIETGEILQTMRMIQEENFDIRTLNRKQTDVQTGYMTRYVIQREIWYIPGKKLKKNSVFLSSISESVSRLSV